MSDNEARQSASASFEDLLLLECAPSVKTRSPFLFEGNKDKLVSCKQTKSVQHFEKELSFNTLKKFQAF